MSEDKLSDVAASMKTCDSGLTESLNVLCLICNAVHALELCRTLISIQLKWAHWPQRTRIMGEHIYSLIKSSLH